jgi:hypothetical protein
MKSRAVLKDIQDEKTEIMSRLATDKTKMMWDLRDVKLQLEDQHIERQVPQDECNVACDEGRLKMSVSLRMCSMNNGRLEYLHCSK